MCMFVPELKADITEFLYNDFENSGIIKLTKEKQKNKIDNASD